MLLINLLKKLAGHYAKLPNPIADDNRLTLRMVGLYAYLATKPDGWRVWLHDVARKHKIGIKSIRSDLKGLTSTGWVTVEKQKDDKGLFTYTIILHAEPQVPSIQKGTVAKPQMPIAQIHATVKLGVVDQRADIEAYNKNKESNKDINNKEEDKNIFDEQFSEKLLTTLVLPTGGRRPDAVRWAQWVREVAAMRGDGYSEDYLEKTLVAVAANDFWPAYVRDTAYFRKKLKEGKLHPGLKPHRPQGTSQAMKVSIELPPDFIEWVKSNAPDFASSYDVRDLHDLFWWEEASRNKQASETTLRVIEEAHKRGLRGVSS